MARTYRFLTGNVEEGTRPTTTQSGFADVAWGALSNEYGLECVYGDVQLVEELASNES